MDKKRMDELKLLPAPPFVWKTYDGRLLLQTPGRLVCWKEVEASKVYVRDIIRIR